MKLNPVRAALLTAVALLLFAAAAHAQAPPLYEAPERLVIKSQVLGEERTILVRTPPAYAARTNERFPVLYMTDGDALGQVVGGRALGARGLRGEQQGEQREQGGVGGFRFHRMPPQVCVAVSTVLDLTGEGSRVDEA
jgi:hypothetical protein